MAAEFLAELIDELGSVREHPRPPATGDLDFTAVFAMPKSSLDSSTMKAAHIRRLAISGACARKSVFVAALPVHVPECLWCITAQVSDGRNRPAINHIFRAGDGSGAR
jgi:hypothetical protein